MKRKRYIRLLMAYGVPRNAAERSARVIQRRGKTYKKQWLMLLRYMRFHHTYLGTGRNPWPIIFRDGFHEV